MIEFEAGPRDDVLMNTNGAIDFTAPPKQIAEGQMGLDCFAFDLDGFDEDFDGLVRPIVQEEIEAADIVRRQSSAATAPAAPRAAIAFTYQPARQRRHRQQADHQRE